MDVTLNIQNMLEEGPIDCILQALQQTAPTSSQAQSMGMSQAINIADVYEQQNFVWIGKTMYSLKNLKPNEKRSFTLKACIYQDGMFNLNRFKITGIQPCRELV